jgi:hypothetical protein
MAAGFQVNLAQVNGQAAGLVISLKTTLSQIQQFQAWLAATGAAGLEAAPISMTAADANVLISAFGDLNDLANVYLGAASTHVTGQYDYRTFSKLLVAYN